MPRSVHLVALLLVVAFVASACESVPAGPEAKPVGVINLTAGPEDAHRAWMALRLAEHFLADGRRVVVFLNVKAPPLASKKLGQDVGYEEKPKFREILAMLVEKGATVLVCQECAAKTGVTAADLLPGVKMASRESLFGPLNENTVVFSY
jgi:predicted peroxiredoxin